MRLAACLASIAAALLGCVSPGRNSLPGDAEHVVVAKVVSSREITTFAGDVAERAFVHIVEPVAQPGRRFELMSVVTCPPPGPSGQLYVLFVKRMRVVVALRAQEPAPRTNQTVVACTPVDTARSAGLAPLR